MLVYTLRSSHEALRNIDRGDVVVPIIAALILTIIAAAAAGMFVAIALALEVFLGLILLLVAYKSRDAKRMRLTGLVPILGTLVMYLYVSTAFSSQNMADQAYDHAGGNPYVPISYLLQPFIFGIVGYAAWWFVHYALRRDMNMKGHQ